ncbi:MAG: alpha/beta fold hydrolase [Streptosporangiaceae bacterium]
MSATSVLTSDGVRLHVTDQGSGPAVLLIAGFTASAISWTFQVDALLEAGYRALCLDRRSHGESEFPAHGQRMSRHGQDVAQTLNALGLDDVALVGGSMGASTIWAYLDLPPAGRVRGVVSVDQTPKLINTPDWPYGFYGLTDENAGTFFARGVPQTGRGFSAERAAEGHIRLANRIGTELRGDLRPEMLPLLRDHAMADWRDVIERTAVPVLMVAGRDSQLWACEHAEAAIAKTAHGRAVIIEDCGHVTNLDQVEKFNASLLAFLREIG